MKRAQRRKDSGFILLWAVGLTLGAIVLGITLINTANGYVAKAEATFYSAALAFAGQYNAPHNPPHSKSTTNYPSWRIMEPFAFASLGLTRVTSSGGGGKTGKLGGGSTTPPPVNPLSGTGNNGSFVFETINNGISQDIRATISITRDPVSKILGILTPLTSSGQVTAGRLPTRIQVLFDQSTSMNRAATLQELKEATGLDGTLTPGTEAFEGVRRILPGSFLGGDRAVLPWDTGTDVPQGAITGSATWEDCITAGENGCDRSGNGLMSHEQMLRLWQSDYSRRVRMTQAMLASVAYPMTALVDIAGFSGERKNDNIDKLETLGEQYLGVGSKVTLPRGIQSAILPVYIGAAGKDMFDDGVSLDANTLLPYSLSNTAARKITLYATPIRNDGTAIPNISSYLDNARALFIPPLPPYKVVANRIPDGFPWNSLETESPFCSSPMINFTATGKTYASECDCGSSSPGVRKKTFKNYQGDTSFSCAPGCLLGVAWPPYVGSGPAHPSPQGWTDYFPDLKQMHIWPYPYSCTGDPYPATAPTPHPTPVLTGGVHFTSNPPNITASAPQFALLDLNVGQGGSYIDTAIDWAKGLIQTDQHAVGMILTDGVPFDGSPNRAPESAATMLSRAVNSVTSYINAGNQLIIWMLKTIPAVDVYADNLVQLKINFFHDSLDDMIDFSLARFPFSIPLVYPEEYDYLKTKITTDVWPVITTLPHTTKILPGNVCTTPAPGAAYDRCVEFISNYLFIRVFNELVQQNLNAINQRTAFRTQAKEAGAFVFDTELVPTGCARDSLCTSLGFATSLQQGVAAVAALNLAHGRMQAK